MRVRRVLFASASACAVLLLAVSTAWACSAMLSFDPVVPPTGVGDPVVQPGSSLTLSVTGATSDVEVRWDHQDSGPLLATSAGLTVQGKLTFTVVIPADAQGLHLLHVDGFAMEPKLDKDGNGIANSDGTPVLERQMVGHTVRQYNVQGSPVASTPNVNRASNHSSPGGGDATGSPGSAPPIPGGLTIPGSVPPVGIVGGTPATSGGSTASVSVPLNGPATVRPVVGFPVGAPPGKAVPGSGAPVASNGSGTGLGALAGPAGTSAGPAGTSAAPVVGAPLALSASGDLWSGFSPAGRPSAGKNAFGLVGGAPGDGGTSTMQLGIVVLMVGLAASIGGLLVVRTRRRLALASSVTG